MLTDMEGNLIRLSQKPNGHLLILGQSGMGKTYFACRKIEEDMEKNQIILIFDWSGSYTQEELEKNRFVTDDKTAVFLSSKASMVWRFRGDGLKGILTSALIKILKILSVYQRRLLQEAMDKLFAQMDTFSMPGLVNIINDMLTAEDEENEQRNIQLLLARLEIFSEINNVFVGVHKEETVQGRKVIILQLSEYADLEREFLVNLFLELLWQELRGGSKRADILLFDEFQHLDLRPGSAVSCILREGRKYGVSAYLSSQFLTTKDKGMDETLMQMGNKIFFRPVERDLREVAEWVDPQEKKKWLRLLDRLNTGEAVVKGNYCIGDGSRICKTPVLCRVCKKN